MDEQVIPVRVQRPADKDVAARALGLEVAGVLRYQMSVLDREDRLESGTGSWLSAFVADGAARERAVRQSVLRTLQMAVNRDYFDILEALVGPGHLRTTALAEASGLGRLTVHERVSDLVSAGLVNKVPEADQVAITPAGMVVVELVLKAVAFAEQDLEDIR